MVTNFLIGLLVLIKLSSQQVIVWENLEDICYFNRSEVNSVDYVKTRCELVAGVQVQKRFFKDDYYWCIAFDTDQEIMFEDHRNVEENIVVPVAFEFLKNRSFTEHHISNLKRTNYSATYFKGGHKINVLFSPENKLLSLKINQTESCDQTRLDEDDPIYTNQKNKNPLKFFEKCVELTSHRQSPSYEYCELLEIVNFYEFVLNGELPFHCIRVNKSFASEQYDDNKLDLILYIQGNYTLRWSNTSSNILATHSNKQFFFQVQDSIIISVEPKANKFYHQILNILVNNVSTCRSISNTEYCGNIFKQHRQFEFYKYPTYPGQYPWQVAIYKHSVDKLYTNHICDGTFIDGNVILTAAHCVFENGKRLDYDRITIIIGQYDLRVSSYYSEEVSNISNIVVHPDFNMETRENDVALVLTIQFETNNFVAPLCYMSLNDALFTQSYGVVPSWPSTNESEYQYILSEAKIVFDTSNSCKGVYNSTEICGRYDFTATTACVRDGGGIVVKFGPGYFLRGIVTMRNSENDKCEHGEQIIFADVNKYSKWIKSKYYRGFSTVEYLYNKKT